MVGLGGAVYPQVIQRIYAAKSKKSLKQSLGAMVFMPLVTVLILFLLGVVSISYFAENEMVARDAVLPTMLRHWGSISNLAFGLTILVIVGLLAAIMSTADSVLLSLSSIIAKDILGKSILKESTDVKLTQVGKIFSWIIMFIMVLVALQPSISLWGLIELKMQLLVQTAPLFLLGIHARSVTSRGMMWGLSIGLGFALLTFMMDWKTITGIQSGLVGLALNVFA